MEGRDFSADCRRRAAIVLPSLDPDGKFARVVDGLVEAGFAHIVIVDDGSAPDHRHFFETAFRVAVRRRRIAVDGTEIALRIHQRVTHYPVLRQTNQGIVDGTVSVRMIIFQHFTDHASAFVERSVVQQAFTEHGV